MIGRDTRCLMKVIVDERMDVKVMEFTVAAESPTRSLSSATDASCGSSRT